MKRALFTFAGVSGVVLAAFAFAAKPPKTELVEFPVEARPVDRAGRVTPTSYADTLERVTPAVVSIRTAQMVHVVRRRGVFLEDVYPEKLQTGLGSGTIIHADGYILTNRHVISTQNGRPAGEITVETADRRTFTARVIGSDPRTDIALIKIDGENLPVARLANSDVLRVGDIVFAIGNPMGVGISVSSGIVSALGRDIGILRRQDRLEHFIQTDASINPGNSGGPLVDAEGRVIGVNTAIISRTGGSVGIGFAVPSNLAVNIITSLVNKGAIEQGYIGVVPHDVTPQLARELKLPAVRGALVIHVGEGTPAERAGLREEDTITAVNGNAVDSSSGLRLQVSRLKPGDVAELEIYREGKRQVLRLTVGKPGGAQ